MKLTFVLRDKKNALKLSTKSIENFIELTSTEKGCHFLES